ncbi:MAG: type II toxin-antitoxin system VapC family toxin [Candidatus Sulfotelmatobacter sp.]
MQSALFDSALYIAALRRGDPLLLLGAISTDAPLWLSAVVLEELYAGANARAFDAVRELEREFKAGDKILVPNADDWADAGKILARLAAKYGHEEIGRGRLTNDALIAMSAGRMGIVVVTTNAKDFRRLAEFRTFQWQLAVTP